MNAAQANFTEATTQFMSRYAIFVVLALVYCLAVAIRSRSSGSMKWSLSSMPKSICTQLILPLNLLL